VFVIQNREIQRDYLFISNLLEVILENCSTYFLNMTVLLVETID